MLKIYCIPTVWQAVLLTKAVESGEYDCCLPKVSEEKAVNSYSICAHTEEDQQRGSGPVGSLRKAEGGSGCPAA